jgi:apocytochrome f
VIQSISILIMTRIIAWPSIFEAYLIFAQQGYDPRKTIGRIVCANCHLAKKPIDIEVP